jgi:hypothetical protein
MRVLAPITELIDKLISNKFAVRDSKQLPCPTARRDLINFSHHEIIKFYNYRVNEFLNFYSFAGNLSAMRKIILILQLSCALTLALKYKLRTKRQAFKKFGRLLTDPYSGQSFQNLHSLIPYYHNT